MKNTVMVSLVALALLGGCSKGESPTASATPAAAPAAQTAYAQGSIKKGDKGHCVVCAVKKGGVEGAETVVESLDYQGKTYVFCNESEKAEFISSPAKYAVK
jgi:YHS domain-containing protein